MNVHMHKWLDNSFKRCPIVQFNNMDYIMKIAISLRQKLFETKCMQSIKWNKCNLHVTLEMRLQILDYFVKRILIKV